MHYMHDVEYAVVDGIHLHLQIIKPATRNEPMKTYPCIVYVQDSAWMEQDVYSEIASVSELAKRGYVLAVVQYRHSRQAHFPAQIQDMKTAIRFMKLNAVRFGVNPEQIILAGCSSGGHTAMFNSIIKDYDIDDRNMFPFPGIDAKVKGIIDYYGAVSLLMEDGNPTTVNHKLPWSPEGMLMNANLRERKDLAEKATVVTHITPELDMPPVCIFHGTKDIVVNTKQSVELYEKLKKCGKDARLYLIEGVEHNSILQQENESMKKHKVTLLLGICLLVAGSVIGCAQKNNNADLESDSEALSENPETLVENEKHYWVNWQGEIFDSTNAPGGVDESLETLVWMAFRIGTVIAENQPAAEDLYITESGQVLGGNEETSDAIWIRMEQEPFIPDEGSFGQISHKDYIFYRLGEDAYVGVQSAEDTETWTILNMAGYGDWLEKEISIYIKMTTGLDVSYVDSSDVSDNKQIPLPQEDFVPIADLLADSNAGDGIEELAVMYGKIPIEQYTGVYEKISFAESTILSENIGMNISGEADWYYISGHTDMQYLIRSENREYSLWKFMCFDCDEYPYKDVLELVYQIDSADMISEIEVRPPAMDNTDGGKVIQDRIGNHEIMDRADIDTIYQILSSLTCYGGDRWDMIDYGAADVPVDAEPSHRAVLLGRYLSIITDYGNEIDGLKYTAVSNMFYEFSGIAYNKLTEEQAKNVYEILGITESVEEL